MENQHKELLEQAIKELLANMDFESEVLLDLSQSDFIMVKIKSNEAGLLIGQGGATMASLQHLARAIVNKKLGLEAPNFIIDVNDYRYNQIEYLKEMALNLAKQVKQEGRSKILELMPSYERRIIHLTLSGIEGIKTESHGEGLLRRVVIKPSSDVS